MVQSNDAYAERIIKIVEELHYLHMEVSVVFSPDEENAYWGAHYAILELYYLFRDRALAELREEMRRE